MIGLVPGTLILLPAIDGKYLHLCNANFVTNLTQLIVNYLPINRQFDHISKIDWNNNADT